MTNKRFFSEPQGMVIAPAGFGKTHFIATSFDYLEGRQLILTHTHAGVASIKSKLAKQGVSKQNFQVETITSFAQHITLSFYTGEESYEQDDKENYFPFVVRTASELVQRKHISDLLRQSFAGLIVDEYQDCTVSLHDFINRLAQIFPSYILGDPLQGIFDFNEPLVDLTCPKQMRGFFKNQLELLEPNRWIYDGNVKLGEDIMAIRTLLENREIINLSKFSSINTISANRNEIYQRNSTTQKAIWELTKKSNVLIIHPISERVPPRKKIATFFGGIFQMVESIDDSEFYTLAKLVDAATAGNILQSVSEIAGKLFGTTNVSRWIKPNRIVKKSKNNRRDIKLYVKLQKIIESNDPSNTIVVVKQLIDFFENDLSLQCYRREILWALKHALDVSEKDKTTVFEAMTANRNIVRRSGRSIYNRCIGTTLLTKGLEFDTVAILDCSKFQCPKNFYVAISRAKKELIIFTENPIVSPYLDEPLESAMNVKDSRRT